MELAHACKPRSMMNMTIESVETSSLFIAENGTCLTACTSHMPSSMMKMTIYSVKTSSSSEVTNHRQKKARMKTEHVRKTHKPSSMMNIIINHFLLKPAAVKKCDNVRM